MMYACIPVLGVFSPAFMVAQGWAPVLQNYTTLHMERVEERERVHALPGPWTDS